MEVRNEQRENPRARAVLISEGAVRATGQLLRREEKPHAHVHPQRKSTSLPTGEHK